MGGLGGQGSANGSWDRRQDLTLISKRQSGLLLDLEKCGHRRTIWGAEIGVPKSQ